MTAKMCPGCRAGPPHSCTYPHTCAEWDDELDRCVLDEADQREARIEELEGKVEGLEEKARKGELAERELAAARVALWQIAEALGGPETSDTYETVASHVLAELKRLSTENIGLREQVALLKPVELPDREAQAREALEDHLTWLAGELERGRDVLAKGDGEGTS